MLNQKFSTVPTVEASLFVFCAHYSKVGGRLGGESQIEKILITRCKTQDYEIRLVCKNKISLVAWSNKLWHSIIM